jgi:myo-inositol-1(or 4)-monophosphatase
LPESDLAEDYALLIAAVKAAGAKALEVATVGFKTYRKADGSQVTDGDLAADDVLRQHLRGQRPHYGWFSEEGKDPTERFGRDHCWIVDPIDGTNDYIHRGTSWCIGAGLLRGSDVIAAAVFQPRSDTLYTAQLHGGAYKNGNKLALAEPNSAVRVMSSKTDAKPLEAQGAQRVSRDDSPFLLRLAKLASGEMDAVVASTSKHDWDLAPATLLVQEAGGTVTDFFGQTVRYNTEAGKQRGIIAASTAAHRWICKTLEVT